MPTKIRRATRSPPVRRRLPVAQMRQLRQATVMSPRRVHKTIVVRLQLLRVRRLLLHHQMLTPPPFAHQTIAARLQSTLARLKQRWQVTAG